MAEGQLLSDGAPWKVMADREALARANLAPTDRFRVFGAPQEPTGHV
jgi:hypothetical protein